MTLMCPDWCRENCVESMLLDVDGTLRAENADGFKDKVLLWIDCLKEAGINLCLVSNAKQKKVKKIAKELHLPYVADAEKPSSLGLKYAMETWGYNPETTIMVGDSLKCDITAAACAGIRSVLVDRIEDKKKNKDDEHEVVYYEWWEEVF